MREETMKRAPKTNGSEMLEEYDFSSGNRGRYVKRYTEVSQIEGEDTAQTCFIITPIGSEGSPEREHFENTTFSIKRIALRHGLNARSSLEIAEPGMITSQIINQ